MSEEAGRKAEALPPDSYPSENPTNDDNLAAIIHELRVHQTELETQNEALRETRSQLEEMQDKFFDLFHFAPVGYFTFDETGRILEVNLTGAELLGRERKFLLQKPLISHLVPESHEEFFLHLQKVLKNRMPQTCELILNRRENPQIYVQVRSIPAQDKDGDVVRCRSVMMDITQLKQTELRLREREKFIHSIAETSPNILYVRNVIENRNVYINRAVYEILGYTVAEIQALGSDFFQTLIHPDDWPAVVDYFSHLEIEPHDVTAFEYRMQHKNGEWRWLYSRNLVFKRDNAGKMTEILGAAQDITERKQTESELMAIKQRYELAIDAGRTSVWDWDIQNDKFYIDSMLQELLGYEDDYVPDDIEAWMSFIHPGDKSQVRQAINKHLEGITPRYGDTHRMIHKDGSIRWILMRGTAMRDETGQAYRMIGTKTDVTDRVRTTEALLELHQQLQAELTLAQEVQTGLLPSPRPQWPNLDVACYSVPAHEVGGDFYTYYALSEAHYILAVGDVSGKGVSAALLMATSLAQLDSLISAKLAPKELLVQLDRATAPYNQPRHRNCALCYVDLMVETPPEAVAETPGQKRDVKLRIANAGCVPPYIRRVNGDILWPDVSGFALGQGLGVQHGYEEVSLSLASGDFVVLTSDGVAEANNNKSDIFGFERLEQAIATGPAKGAQAMLEHLKTAITTFMEDAELQDDLTIVVLQVK